MSEQKPKIPRVVAGLDVKALPLTPIEGFVLSRIDGSATVSDIADLTSQEAGEVRSILGRLERLSAIEWADAGITLPRTSYKPTSTMPRALTPAEGREGGGVRLPAPAPVPRVASGSGTPTHGVPAVGTGSERPRAVRHARSSQTTVASTGGSGARVGASAGPPPPSPPAEHAMPATPGAEPVPAAHGPELDIPAERRQRIDDMWVALDLLGHYEVLGLKRSAAKADIRKAYFDLSKAFHPDTVFRKNVGSYRHKMEGIFKRLTEAYEVLGKAKARAEYDAYLDSIGETKEAEEVLSGEHEIPESLRSEPPPSMAPAPPASLPGPGAASASAHGTPAEPAVGAPSSSGSQPGREPPAMPAETRPTDEGRRNARELMARKLEGATSSAVTRSGPNPPRPPEAAPARTKDELVRDLAGAVRASSTLTGGGDVAARHFLDGKRAGDGGDLPRAVRELRMAMQAAPDRKEYGELHDRLSRELATSLAGRYLEQAEYEERHGKWAAAALSWSKVCEGRPEDAKAQLRAAGALLEAKGDLHRAQAFAQRGLELAGESGSARRLLGRIYAAAGMKLNARRELTAALALDPKDALAQSLLGQLKD